MVNMVDLKVLDIYLDAQNPRHEPISNQSEIIEHLIKHEKIKPLARDIAENGLSPIELFAVIKDDTGQYIAVEGNRRLCSLTLLNDPERAPSGQVPYFKRLSDQSSKFPEEIRCALFEDRESADIWIVRRHEGEQEGRGTRQWDSEQKTRHNTRNDKTDPNALAQSVLEYARLQGFINKDNSEKILTTAARYLGNPLFRETLGIESSRSDPNVVIKVTYSDFRKVIKRFCDDLINKESAVGSRSKKKDWEAYARELIKNGDAPEERISSQKLAGWSSSEGKVDSSGVSNATQSHDEMIEGSGEDEVQKSETGSSKQNTDNVKKYRNSDPDKRTYALPVDFNAPINDAILKRVYHELKSIKVDENTLAVSLLSRAFLENLYSFFVEKKQGSHVTGQTHVLMQRAIGFIDADQANLTKKEKQALGALRRVQSNENNVLSPKTLGAFAHASHYPDSTQLKREWDNIGVIVEYMLKALGE